MFHTLSNRLDINARINPILSNLKEISPQDLQVGLTAALPLLTLFKPLQGVLALGTGGYQVFVLGSQLYKDYQNKNQVEFNRTRNQLALVVTSLALSIIVPPVATALSVGLQVVADIARIQESLKKNDRWEAAKSALHIGDQVVYLAASVYATPGLLLISIVAQGCLELYQSHQEFQKNNKLGAAANLLTGLIRLSQAAPHAQAVYRNAFGKEIKAENVTLTISEVQNPQAKEIKNEDIPFILQEIEKQRKLNPEKLVDFEKILQDNNFSNKINKITFQGNDNAKLDFSEVIFRNIDFNSCVFKFVNFYHSKLLNITFSKCKFEHVIASQTTLYNVPFISCHIKSMDLTHSHMTRVTFDNPLDMRYTSFASSIIKDSIFKKGLGLSTNFSDAELRGVNFEDFHLVEGSDFRNTVQKDVAFSRCILLEPNFNNNHMSNVTMTDTTLRSAQFENSVLESMKFTKISFGQHGIKGCSFNDSKLKRIEFDECLMGSYSSWVDFQNANLEDITIKNSQVKGSFINGVLNRVNILLSTIADILFTGSKVKDSTASGCKILTPPPKFPEGMTINQ